MEKSVSFEGRKISFDIIGEGDHTVVFVHGFGEDHRVWNEQVKLLSKRYKLVIPDLPGSGKSAMINDMSMEGLAAALHHLLQSLKADFALSDEKFIMIGHSMGGYITLAFAEKYPDMLGGFGLFHSSAYPDSDERKHTRQRGIQFIRTNGADKFQEQSIPNLFSDFTKNSNSAMVQAFVAQNTGFDAEALEAYYVAMINRPDRSGLLRTYDNPVLFVAGKSDTAVTLDQVLKQVYLPPLAYFHVLEHSAHLGMLEEISASNALLSAYLDNCFATTGNEQHAASSIK